MLRRTLVCLLSAVIVSSCAIDSPHSIYPIASKKTPNDLIALAGTDQIEGFDLTKSRKILIGLHNLLDDASRSREKKSVVAAEILYYGTLVAVLGVTLDSRAARNTGAAVAAGAELFTGHYKLTDQRVVFDKAIARVDCARDAISPLTQSVLNTFPSQDLDDVQPKPTNDQLASGVKDAATSLAELPQNTLDFVNKVQGDLKVALSKVVLSAPSKDELKSSVDTWDKARQVAKLVAPGTTENNQAVAAAQNKVGALSQEVEQKFAAQSALEQRYRTLAQGNKLGDLEVAQTKIVELKQDQIDLSQQLATASAELEALKRTQAVIKAQQTIFVSALYAYKATLNLCLQQNQQ